MSRPSSATARGVDNAASTSRARKKAPQLAVIASNSMPSIPSEGVVEVAVVPAAAQGGAGVSPKTSKAGLAPTHSLQRGMVALTLIDIAGDRLRARDEDWEDVIASTYDHVGQLQAVRLVREANGRFTLDGFGFGVSRIEAARLKGWAEVEAEWCERGETDPRFYRLPEIVENIARRRLIALDECRFLAEYKAIHERLYPATANGGDTKHKQSLKRQNEMISFRSTAAEQTGLTTRSIEIKVAIWNGLGPEVREQLRGSALADNQAALRQLAAFEYGLQAKVVQLLCSTPPGAATVADAAVLALGKRLPSADDKRFNAVAGSLTRLSAAARRPLWTTYADEIIVVLKAEGLI